MYVVDISNITHPKHDRVSIVARVQYFWDIRDWLSNKSYKFLYDEWNLPVSVSFADRDDALAFKLRFEI